MAPPGIFFDEINRLAGTSRAHVLSALEAQEKELFANKKTANVRPELDIEKTLQRNKSRVDLFNYQLGRLPGRTVERKEYQGSIWPNGEFAVGIGYHKMSEADSFRSFDMLAERGMSTGLSGASLDIMQSNKPGSRVLGNEDMKSPTPMLNQDGSDSAQSAVRLDSSNVPNSHTRVERAPRGSKGMSRDAARMVRNAAHVLEVEVGRENLAFATLTLPSHPDIDWIRVVEAWPEVVRRFVQKIKRLWERKTGGAFEYVCCYEVQTHRQQKYGGIPLHVHMVFQGRGIIGGRRFDGWVLSPKQISSAWKQALVSQGFPEDCNWGSVENVQRVRKSVSDYLGKYMSKGTTHPDCSGIILPSWSGMSDSLRRRVRSMVVKNKVAVAALYCYVHQNAAPEIEGVLWWRPATFEISEGVEIPWGFTGRISASLWSDIGEIRKSHYNHN